MFYKKKIGKLGEYFHRYREKNNLQYPNETCKNFFNVTHHYNVEFWQYG